MARKFGGVRNEGCPCVDKVAVHVHILDQFVDDRNCLNDSLEQLREVQRHLCCGVGHEEDNVQCAERQQLAHRFAAIPLARIPVSEMARFDGQIFTRDLEKQENIHHPAATGDERQDPSLAREELRLRAKNNSSLERQSFRGKRSQIFLN